MKKIDVVIISDAKNNHFRSLTQSAVDTCQFDTDCAINPIVVESFAGSFYERAKTIHPSIPFGYNSYLNLGAKCGNSEYIAFCNNDLVFTSKWASRIIDEMNALAAGAASPYCPYSHKVNATSIRENTGSIVGIQIRTHFAGWCFVLRREVWEKIGGLDERLKFWCCDDATIEQLKSAGVKHILVTESIVKHLDNGSKTLKTLMADQRKDFTTNEIKKFNFLYDKNLFNLGK